MDQTLKALHRAALLVAGTGQLDDVLQQIVDVARELLGAQYAALGVPNQQNLLDQFIYSGISPEDVAAMEHLPRGFGLLGAIIKEHKTIRIKNIADDKRSVGFPANHPPMDNFLGIPVVGNDIALGNLYLCNKIDGDSFSAADEELAELFAAHAAIAIQNARLDEEIQRLAILEERTRIGMDLHDGIIQSIYAVGLLLENTTYTLVEDPDEAQGLISQSIEGLNDAIRDIRNFILDLRPHRYGGDLVGGINRLAQEFRANSMVEISVDLPDKGMRNLPPKIGRTLFLTVQNALANVARHARATHTMVQICRKPGEIILTIKDNGIGFDQTKKNQTVGHGLSNMKVRAQRLNGQFKLSSIPNQGTLIELILPA
ncbi:MAG: signal transduction histidine kinase [Cellvibrionaceae bacterium]|jgi:signal transduction histidine kinase